MSIKQTSLYTYSGYKKHNTSRIFYVKTNKTAINFKPFPPFNMPYNLDNSAEKQT